MKNKLHHVVRIPTPESLAKTAFSYLGRYAASEGSLRRVLQNRIRRASLSNPVLAKDVAAQKTLRNAIETIIEKHRKLGVLNDASYAAMKAGSLRREGRSRRFIQQKLALKGVGAKLAEVALAEIDSEAGPEAELKAARAFAKRRKLGPFRAGITDDDRRRKDLAVLARAGFSFGIAQKALGTNFEFDE